MQIGCHPLRGARLGLACSPMHFLFFIFALHALLFKRCITKKRSCVFFFPPNIFCYFRQTVATLCPGGMLWTRGLSSYSVASRLPTNCVLAVIAKIYVLSVLLLTYRRVLRWPSY